MITLDRILWYGVHGMHSACHKCMGSNGISIREGSAEDLGLFCNNKKKCRVFERDRSMKQNGVFKELWVFWYR